ncbi:MAG TPA: glucosaminidase domain-containing protein [Oscillatoriaceae cyanobacterium]
MTPLFGRQTQLSPNPRGPRGGAAPSRVGSGLGQDAFAPSRPTPIPTNGVYAQDAYVRGGSASDPLWLPTGGPQGIPDTYVPTGATPAAPSPAPTPSAVPTPVAPAPAPSPVATVVTPPVTPSVAPTTPSFLSTSVTPTAPAATVPTFLAGATPVAPVPVVPNLDSASAYAPGPTLTLPNLDSASVNAIAPTPGTTATASSSNLPGFLGGPTATAATPTPVAVPMPITAAVTTPSVSMPTVSTPVAPAVPAPASVAAPVAPVVAAPVVPSPTPQAQAVASDPGIVGAASVDAAFQKASDLLNQQIASNKAPTPTPIATPAPAAPASSSSADQASIDKLKAMSEDQLKQLGANDKQGFLDALKPAAQEAEKEFGVPAAVTLAQAALETGWGQHIIPGYNLFGMKGTGPAGTVNEATFEVQNGQHVNTNANFQKFHNFYEAVVAHGQLFHNGYYDKAISDYQKNHDPKQFANDLTGIYATAPNYGSTLIDIMNTYHLA